MNKSADLIRNDELNVYQNTEIPTLNTGLRLSDFSTMEQQRLIALGVRTEEELRQLEQAIKVTFQGYQFDAVVLDVFEGERSPEDRRSGNVLVVQIQPGAQLRASDEALRRAVSRATDIDVRDISILREVSR
jgi:hypothetical protein